jgi:uncharacterized membrane protein
MAGQPPEPSFQPSGQDQALTQGRPAWQQQQQPAYTPPPAAPGGQQGYSAPSYAPQDQAYAAAPPEQTAYSPPEQTAYSPQDQTVYPPQDQTYTALGQGQDYQNYQGYQPPSYGAQPGQGAAGAPPQWQGIAGVKPAAPRTKQAGEKGFLGSLFDFSFSSFVTPKIIKVLYVLFTIWTALIGITILIVGFKTGGIAGGLFTLIIIEPIFLLLTLGIYRVVLEAFMVIFRIYEETKKIREGSESPSQT